MATEVSPQITAKEQSLPQRPTADRIHRSGQPPINRAPNPNSNFPLETT